MCKNELLQQTMENLKRNNMEAVYLQDVNQLNRFLKDYISSGATVSFGGSVTLKETGTYDYLCRLDQEDKIRLLDRDQEGADKESIHRESFFCDYYLTSSNAITKNGYLYNVDGNGNRVAAMIFGPKKVLVIVGENKLVETKQDAEKRMREIAAPQNAQRLKLKTPCAVTGSCMDCESPERICCAYTLLGPQRVKGRITVVILGQSFGY